MFNQQSKLLLYLNHCAFAQFPLSKTEQYQYVWEFAGSHALVQNTHQKRDPALIHLNILVVFRKLFFSNFLQIKRLLH
jgi:hypothetical protein